MDDERAVSRSQGQQGSPGTEDDADTRHLAERSALLPEERAAGSDVPHEQAAAVLDDSQDRTEHPDADASTQSGRRTSADSSG